MNEQQILFIVGKSRLKYLDEQGKTRELTFAELREINEIKEILFEIIVRYAIKLIYAHLNRSGVVSAFHWVSHLLTEDYELTAKYGSPDDDSDAQGLTPGSITEIEIIGRMNRRWY